jgi:hypothetical protein
MKPAQCFALCLTILGVGLPAAADEKSVAAAICQPQYIPSGASISYTDMGGVAAVGGSIYVVCPLMRDRMNWGTHETQMYTELTIPSGGSVYCALYSQNEDGLAANVVDVDTENRTTAGLGSIGLSVNPSNGNEGAYGLFCSLSAGSILYHISTNENNNGTE